MVLLVAGVADTEILTSQGQHVAVMQMEVPQGVNGDLMERLATSLPLSVLDRHADDLFQLEALFIGQAGLLELEIIPEKFHNDLLMEGYFAKLRNEYLYLGLRSMTAGDSQSLIQLQREYCNKHQCLRCRFGYEFLKK